MNEENKNLDAEGKPIEGAEGAAAEEEAVKLTPAQYNAMLDGLDELEDLKSNLARQAASPTVDSLADEGKAKPSEGRTDEDLSEVKPQELIDLILKEVETKVSQPLMVKMEEMRVKEEIRELMRDEENKDFWDYKEGIFDIATRNPNLSIKEAYKLAKSTKGPSEKSDGGDKKKDLKNLPNRRKIPVGEKPGPSGDSVADTEPETRKDAASMAWERMEKEGKV